MSSSTILRAVGRAMLGAFLGFAAVFAVAVANALVATNEAEGLRSLLILLAAGPIAVIVGAAWGAVSGARRKPPRELFETGERRGYYAVARLVGWCVGLASALVLNFAMDLLMVLVPAATLGRTADATVGVDVLYSIVALIVSAALAVIIGMWAARVTDRRIARARSA